MKRVFSFWAAICCLCFSSISSAEPFDQVPQFIDDMVDKYQLNRSELEVLFHQVQYLPKIIAIMDRPASATKTWPQYRDGFVASSRINPGVDFATQYQASLLQAEQTFGVPKEIVLGIVGVETIYGRYTGDFRIVDALATLAFDYPRRAEFFRSELEQFLLLAREQRFDPLEIKGSYAGAMGLPQFMPSSYRKWAVDFNRDQKIDLFNSREDVIGSVAHYLQDHGWIAGQPVAVKVVPSDLIKGEWNKERKTIAEWGLLGVSPERAVDAGLVAQLRVYQLDELNNEYWLVFNNFDVILTYNKSNYYAMSVYQLGEALKQRLNR